jgi:hypothetical protein
MPPEPADEGEHGRTAAHIENRHRRLAMEMQSDRSQNIRPQPEIDLQKLQRVLRISEVQVEVSCDLALQRSPLRGSLQQPFEGNQLTRGEVGALCQLLSELATRENGGRETTKNRRLQGELLHATVARVGSPVVSATACILQETSMGPRPKNLGRCARRLCNVPVTWPRD